jgi:HK97 gp10 family phage protein
MRVRVLGTKQVQKRLSELNARTRGRYLVAAGRAAGLPIERTWKSMFRPSGAPSIAGAPPRRQSGQYSRSIHIEVEAVGADKAVVRVGTNLTDPPYPWFLEFGTSRMPPHPIARPAFEKSKGEAAREGLRVLRAQLGLKRG